MCNNTEYSEDWMKNNRGFKVVGTWVACLFALPLIVVTAIAGQGGNTQLCLTRNQTIHAATMLYAADNNERLVPLQSDTHLSCTNQKYLAQLILPYHGDWMNYRCPADETAQIYYGQNACTGFSTRAYTRAQQFATWSILAHRGYNYLFLAPVANSQAISYPVEVSQIANPANTLMYLDSVWDRTSQGVPYGGGTWGVDAPCIRDANNALALPLPPGFTVYFTFGGWDQSHPFRANYYGYAWPWHDKTFVGVTADGSAQVMTVSQITAGCDLRNNHWGPILDMEAYMWDIYE